MEGNANSTARVTIGESGRFKGKLKAKTVIIEGRINDKVSADERVEIRRSGECRGEVTTPSIMISDNLQEKKTDSPKKPEQDIKVVNNVVAEKQSPDVIVLQKK